MINTELIGFSNILIVLFDKITELDSLDEQKIHVDWHQNWDDEKWRGSKYLVHRLVSNDREGRGVVEDVVVFVMPPELEVGVAQLVVEELKQVADHPGEEEGEDVIVK